MAWYQRIYFNLKFFFYNGFYLRMILSLSFLFIFFDFLFITENIYCFKINKPQPNFLNKYLIGGHNVYFYKNISYEQVYNTIYHIKSTPSNKINFDISFFKDKSGLLFPYNHPYSHPHINFMYNFDQFNEIYVTLQLSSSNFNDFTLLDNWSINKNKSQFVFNNFYMCRKEDMIKNFYDFSNSLNFIKNNNIKINNHFDLVRNFHKI